MGSDWLGSDCVGSDWLGSGRACPPCAPTPADPPRTRRHWIADAARYAALLGLGLLSAGLVVKRAVVPAAERCPGPIDCRRCAVLAGCASPAASLARRSRKG